LSVYILMSFDFPFVKYSEFGNFVITLIENQYTLYDSGFGNFVITLIYYKNVAIDFVCLYNYEF